MNQHSLLVVLIKDSVGFVVDLMKIEYIDASQFFGDVPFVRSLA